MRLIAEKSPIDETENADIRPEKSERAYLERHDSPMQPADKYAVWTATSVCDHDVWPNDAGSVP